MQISGEPSVIVTFEDGLGIVKSVRAMAESHHQRRWIEIA
jgi:hypothetical protein